LHWPQSTRRVSTTATTTKSIFMCLPDGRRRGFLITLTDDDVENILNHYKL